MSFNDHAAARRVKGLRGTTQAVFRELAFRTTHDDGLHECTVKVATLCEALGKADQAIRLAIKELRAANLIRTTRGMRRDGKLGCFMFKLIMPFPPSVTVPSRLPRNKGPAVISTALLSGSSLSQSSIGFQSATAEPVAISTSEKVEEDEKILVSKINPKIEINPNSVGLKSFSQLPWTVALPKEKTVHCYTKYWEDLAAENLGKVYVAPLGGLDQSKLEWLLVRSADPLKRKWDIAYWMELAFSNWTRVGEIFARELSTDVSGSKGYPPKPILSFFVKGLLQLVSSADAGVYDKT